MTNPRARPFKPAGDGLLHEVGKWISNFTVA